MGEILRGIKAPDLSYVFLTAVIDTIDGISRQLTRDSLQPLA
jgi:hypothetical protein